MKRACFIDSNIWLYAFIENDKAKSERARELIRGKENEIWLSPQVINEVSVNLRKKAKLPEVRIQRLVNSFYGKYRVLGFQKEILIQASKLRQKRE